MLKELADIIARPPLIIFDQSRQKESLLSLISVPGMVMEQLILETISRHVKDKKLLSIEKFVICLNLFIDTSKYKTQ